MQKLKDQLENACEWPTKCENHECFLPCEFPIIRYMYYDNYMNAQANLRRLLSQNYPYS